MPNDYVLDAHISEHLGGNFARVGSGIFKVEILRSNADIVTFQGLGNGANISERHAKYNFSNIRFQLRRKLFRERCAFGWGFIHLPVARYNLFFS